MYVRSSVRTPCDLGPGRGEVTRGSVVSMESLPACAFSCVFKLDPLR